MKPIMKSLKLHADSLNKFAAIGAAAHMPEVREVLAAKMFDGELDERYASLLLMATQCEAALKGDRTFSVIELNATTDDALPFVEKGWQPPLAIGVALVSQKRNGKGFGGEVTHLDITAMSFGGGSLTAKDVPVVAISPVDLAEVCVDLIEKARVSAQPDGSVDGAFFASAAAAMAMAVSRHSAMNGDA